jgi:sugar lactone lactonase YvrE
MRRKHPFPLILFLFLAGVVCAPARAGIGTITTIAGGGPKNVLATKAHLHNPTDVVTDSQGNVYIVTSGQSEVFRVDVVTSVLTAAAGSDSSGFSGDGGPAKQASLNGPYGLAVDAAGNLFIADSFNERIRRVDAVTHQITTFAGGGTGCAGHTYIGDSCAATDAILSLPSGVAVDGAGNVLIADLGHNRIRRVDAVTGVITTVAGGKASNLGTIGDGGLATDANLSFPQGVSLDGAGNVLIADTNHNRIRRVDATTNIISTVAAGLSLPVRVVADAVGNLFITESSKNRIRRVDVTSGVITTFAGTGGYGYAGDNGPAASATLANPYGINFDRAGNLLIADAKNNRVRHVDVAANVITTSAGASGPMDYDLGARQASLSSVGQVVIDGAGNVFISEAGSATLLRLDSVTNLLSKLAGDGFGAPFDAMFGLARDRAGNLFVADETQIWRVDSVTGVATTVAGRGGNGCPEETDGLGDGCPATDAWLEPLSIAVDDAGNLFIGDGAGGNSLVRRVDRVTQITTIVAGVVAGGSSGCPQEINDIGDGCLATHVDLGSIGGVAVDSKGNVLLATGSRVRRVNASTHIITTVAGNGDEAYSGDNGPATSAGVAAAQVAVDGVGNLFIAEPPNSRIRRVDAVTKVITTVAGNGTPGVSGDGGLATKASIRPAAVSVDGLGNLFIGDGANFRVRKVPLGVPGILLSRTALNFGNVVLNTQSPSQTVTITNNGTALLEFFSIAASGRFRQSNTCHSGVQPGAACQVSVIFVPNSVGAQSAVLAIRPNIVGGPRKITLSGVGISQ